eukprot:11133561-Prorocentrum_lima.AAC.1
MVPPVTEHLKQEVKSQTDGKKTQAGNKRTCGKSTLEKFGGGANRGKRLQKWSAPAQEEPPLI